MSLYDYSIDYNIFNLFDRENIFQYNIMPIVYDDLFIYIATSDHNQKEEKLKELFNHPVKLLYVPHHELQFEWRYYEIKSKLYKIAKEMARIKISKEETQEVSRFIKELFLFAIQLQSSDIHIEALDQAMVIRLRIDGVLQQLFRFDKGVFSQISSYIKYLSNLDIAQKRLPLNSRFTYTVNNVKYDFRVSTLPTIHGESLVLRVLNNKDTKKSLDKIGFDNLTFEKIQKISKEQKGLFLVTGPTGSGKTTTLYSLIEYLNSLEKKIITIEDPVEYKIDNIMQVSINHEIDLDYYTVLKNILRQDPDILLIGEIRDEESLKIAIQAALTGHFVLATLHTNSAIETILRLLDLGAEPFLVAATLKGVLSQRLVRVLCDNCKIEQGNSYLSVGCRECSFTGYHTRKVVSEILEVDEVVKKFILKEFNLEQLKKHLEKINFTTLNNSCKTLVAQGITTEYKCISCI